MRLAAIAVVLSLSVILGGCVAKTGSSSSDNPKASQGGIRKVCTETTCDQCMSSSNPECDSCMSNCYGLTDPGLAVECVSTCNDICSSPHSCEAECSGDSPCVDWKYELDLPEHVDQKVLQACRAENQHMLDCSPDAQTADCDVASRILRPETAPIMTCYSKASCSSDPNCGAVPASSTLGEDLCHACNDQDDCDPGTRQAEDGLGDGFIPSIQAALHSCIAQSASCSDALDCESAVLEKLIPGSPDPLSN